MVENHRQSLQETCRRGRAGRGIQQQRPDLVALDDALRLLPERGENPSAPEPRPDHATDFHFTGNPIQSYKTCQDIFLIGYQPFRSAGFG
ncbi:hypothetical protein D3C87_1613190 [compost metagenome]